MISELVLATHNQGKINELRDLLSFPGLTVQDAATLDLAIPDETGSSFEANAEIKARAACDATGLPALADDSGLEVFTLNGAPGVQTSEFGGWQRLLKVMHDAPEAQRGARFVCVLALVFPNEPTRFFRGECEGIITVAGRGEQGFGYDPVFVPAGETRTFAEMTKTEKSAYSHRGKALMGLKNWLLNDSLKQTTI